MNLARVSLIAVVLSMGWVTPGASTAQDVASQGVPGVPALPRAGANATNGVVATFSGQKVKPLTEGPLHEAFLSPRKDLNPQHTAKAPPPPITERPGIDPPSTSPRNGSRVTGNGIRARTDFVWVTGTWRVPPPGRFWVNGYWKRDDKGWYRVAGFWSERRDRPARLPQERARRRIAPTTIPARPRRTIAFISRASITPTATGRLEERVLDQGPARLVVGSRPVGPPARRLGVPGRILGPRPRRSRHLVRPGRGRSKWLEAPTI